MIRRFLMKRRSGRLGHRPGFTLIEMLVTVVVLGILASISMKLVSVKRNAFLAAMKSDIRNLAVAEETFFALNLTYTSLVGDGMGMGCEASGGKALGACPGVDWWPTTGVVAELYGDGLGFSGRMTHTQIPDRCAMFRGLPPTIFLPATEEGILACVGVLSGMGMGMGGM